MNQEATSDQEQQMLEVLHEWQGHPNARLVVEISHAPSRSEMTASINGEQHSVRGVGRSFNEAWDNINPT